MLSDPTMMTTVAMGKWSRRRDTSPKGIRPPTLWSSNGLCRRVSEAGYREVCEGVEDTDLSGVAVVGLLLWKRLWF